MASDPEHAAFDGRRLCIATMHGKQRAIAPCLERRLGVRCLLPPAAFDSDAFGTFTGEVARAGSAREAARAKAGAAMDLTGVDLAVASEGSFVPHPDAPLLPVGLELVLLVDRRHGLEIPGEDFTTETNHARRACASREDAFAFAERIGFPEHALVLAVGDPPHLVHRGVDDPATLRRALDDVLATAERLGLPWFTSSDMRADRNPQRMRAIARAAAALAERAARPCPECRLPGFGQVDVVRGLPCALCGEPTAWARAFRHACARCPAVREVPRADGLTGVDPGHCPVCNP